jgi:tungstate transport system substrate-binding protein
MRRLPILLALGLALAGCARSEPESELLLATTTSVRDSGLLDALLPAFSERTGIQVRTIAVGSGAALRMGEEGNADVLLTHAPEREKALVDSGVLAARRELMENHFVIAGPPEDPAEVRAAESAPDAYRRLHAANAPYASRADDSGTHMRERALLAAAGLDADADWEAVTRTGSGMGATLQVAGERRAYVLSDLGTFLAFQERTGLAALSGADPALRNVYSVMRVSPDRFPERLNTENAIALESYLLAAETQRAIGRFGTERFERPLFRPLLLDD